ncbi:MAG: hypothetical protein EB059_00500 [Alphaproteobacteria bacterium]|nr:hypothetical protein [Alphaproteobacteria bacterium]
MRYASKTRGMILAALLVLSSVAMLSGCSYLRGRDRAVDTIPIPRTSASTDTKREACVRACNNDHDLCMAGPPSRNTNTALFDAPAQIIGASAGCDQAMRDCMKMCK